MLSAIAVTLYRTSIVIMGTPQNDKVAVSEHPSGLLVEYQTENGRPEVEFYRRDVIKNLKTILFDGDGGDDQFDGSKTTTYRFVLYGGPGNDVLQGGAKNDTLWGEQGFDRLYGHGGDRDKLVGGKDYFADFLDAGSGDSGKEVHTADGEDFHAYQPALGPGNGIQIEDVNQQGGNCGIAAALAAIAGSSSKARQDLADRIRYLGNHKYVVKMYIAPGVPQEVQVHFDGSVTKADLSARSPSLDAWKSAPHLFPKRGYSGEFWPLLYQRAYLKIADRITGTTGTIHRPMLALSGRVPQVLSWTSGVQPDSAREAMALAINRGKPVAAGTFRVVATDLVMTKHAYTVTKVGQDKTGKWIVELRNPKGHDNRYKFDDEKKPRKLVTEPHRGEFWDGLVVISWNEFRKSFNNIYIGG